MTKIKFQLSKYEVMGLITLHNKYRTNIEQFIIRCIESGLRTFDTTKEMKAMILEISRHSIIAPFNIGNITIVIPMRIKEQISQMANSFGIKRRDLLRAFITGGIRDMNDIDIVTEGAKYMR